MSGDYRHYLAKGLFDGERLGDVVRSYGERINSVVQGNYKAFMLSEDVDVLNRVSMDYGGRSVCPVFGDGDLGSVLSFDGFSKMGCNVDCFDHFALLFGTRVSPEVGDSDFGCGASAVYVSRLKPSSDALSIPYPSGAYVEKIFFDVAGVGEGDRIKGGWVPRLPELRVVGD